MQWAVTTCACRASGRDPDVCRQRAFFQGQLDKLRRQAAAEAKAARVKHSQDVAQNAALLAQLNGLRRWSEDRLMLAGLLETCSGNTRSLTPLCTFLSEAYDASLGCIRACRAQHPQAPELQLLHSRVGSLQSSASPCGICSSNLQTGTLQ